MKLPRALRTRMQLRVEHDGLTLRIVPAVYCRREIKGCIDYWLRFRCSSTSEYS